MVSEGKDGSETKLPAANQAKDKAVAAEQDLDKNPIKYVTSDGSLSLEAHDKEYMEMTLRNGQHSSFVQKLLRKRIEQRAKEFPRWPGDDGGGVRVMWIESRFWYDRERLGKDFDQDWRSYRAKYLHSLELDPREPVHVPEYEKSLINPIRRFYMKGGDWLEYKVIRKFTEDKFKSGMYRAWITRSAIGWVAAIGAYYWFRYNHRTWDTNGGPVLFVSRPIIYPDHPKYPFVDYKTLPCHHEDQSFLRRKNFYEDLRHYEDTWTVL